MEIRQGVRDVIISEYFSSILLAIIFVYSLMDRNRSSLKQQVFRVSILTTFILVLSIIASFFITGSQSGVSPRLRFVASSFLYIATCCSIASVTGAMVVTIFDFRADSPKLRIAAITITVVCALEILLALVNVFTGWLFTIDPDGVSHNGPLYRIDLVYLLLSFVMIIILLRVEGKRVKRSSRIILYTLPVLAVILGIYQHLYIGSVLTGTILSSALLVLFIYGQQQRLHTDPLTELSNREAFFHALQRLSVRQRGFRVIMIGLEQFKFINNTLGQRLGDAFLREVGVFLSALDPRVSAYRFTGVEFALVAVNIPDQSYETLFSHISERFQHPWHAEGEAVYLNAAISDIRHPGQVVEVDELIAALEYSVRIAKKDETAGGVVRFDGQLRSAFGRRNYVLAQMERALAQERFFIYIQPVYDCAKKCFSGGEVLLRLNEDSGRPISPGEFIPLAIEAGIATELGWMVLEKTCRFISENRHMSVDWFSVNISSQQNEFDETVRRLELLLEKYDIPPSSIKLEITERVLLDDLDRARATINKLREQGVGVFLDDFGTGYSNLVNVMSLPFECIKIDKDLLRGIAQNPKAYGLLQTVVNGIRNMETIVLAEGVETQEQDSIVHRLGIDFIQGYYYARPMPPEEFLWLTRQTAKFCGSNALKNKEKSLLRRFEPDRRPVF
jgi:diguanylate cyclase (GGDEF)-like protein